VRAATPSAAAEIVLPDIAELNDEVADIRDTMIELMEQHLASNRTSLAQVEHRLWLQSPAARLQRADQTLHGLTARLQAATRSSLVQQHSRVEATRRLLDSLHPGRVLARGFAMVENPATGRPVRRLTNLPDGEVAVWFEDGRATGTLTPETAGATVDERKTLSR
jgi:exodeoxyribonuclease VII large subunit